MPVWLGKGMVMWHKALGGGMESVRDIDTVRERGRYRERE